MTSWPQKAMILRASLLSCRCAGVRDLALAGMGLSSLTRHTSHLHDL